MELPRLGRKVPELNDENVRELPLYAYRILYELTSADIAILAVIHKRQDLLAEAIPRQP
ncbi:MAG: type II toxin-antitoxin system RelE/ParE family toxin [Pseudomonadota bacterium]